MLRQDGFFIECTPTLPLCCWNLAGTPGSIELLLALYQASARDLEVSFCGLEQLAV